MGFRQLDETVLHAGRVISLRVGTFEAPDGTVLEREIVRHPGAVSIVAVDHDGRVVLVRQYRAALDAEILELPAGKLDQPGEDPLECARRELAEEVGLAADRWEKLTEMLHSPGFCDELGHVFLARGLHEVPDDRQGSEEQAMTVGWWPLADAVQLCTDGTVADAKTIIGLLLARERVQQSAPG